MNKFSDREEFGCNIMTVGNAQYSLAYVPTDQIVKCITAKVKESYSNIIMFNLTEEETNFVEATKGIKKLYKHFPWIKTLEVPSSMGDYNTHLYILDVSKIKREYAYRRSNSMFEEIDLGDEDFDDEDDFDRGW